MDQSRRPSDSEDSRSTKRKSMHLHLDFPVWLLTSARRHRRRKAEYAQTLETQISRLQWQDALANSEVQRLQHENAAMRQTLDSLGLPDLLQDTTVLSPERNLHESPFSLTGDATDTAESTSDEVIKPPTPIEPATAQSSFDSLLGSTLDDSSRSRIEQCRILLLGDIRKYE